MANYTETEIEELADEIAHDLVTPPDDDAGDAEMDEAFRLVDIASAAAQRALSAGGTIDEARAAARKALDATTQWIEGE